MGWNLWLGQLALVLHEVHLRPNSGKQGDLYFNLFYWSSLLARLNSHYETWSHKKKKYKMHTGNLSRKNLQVKMSVKCLIESYLDHSLYKPWFSLNLMYLCLCSVCFFFLFAKYFLAFCESDFCLAVLKEETINLFLMFLLKYLYTEAYLECWGSVWYIRKRVFIETISLKSTLE